MSTTFPPLRNNARGRVVTPDALNSTNATDDVPLETGQGTSFAAGMFVTAWDDLTYPSNPRQDPHYRMGIVTTVTGDTLDDVAWVDNDGNPSTPGTALPGTPGVRGFIMKAHFDAIYDAINDLEDAGFAVASDATPAAVAGAAAHGSSAEASRADHIHVGVHKITADSTDLSGNITLAEGDNVTIDVASSTITIAAPDLVKTAEMIGAVAANNAIFSTPNPSNICLYIQSTGSGFIDLKDTTGASYTVPAGRRAILTLGNLFNTTAGNITCAFGVKISGTSYFGSSITTVNLNSLAAQPCQVIAEAGESFCVNASASGLNIWADVIEFDDSANIVRAINVTPASGDNILYTVPGGKTARLMGNGSCGIYNGSGSNRDVSMYAVPSGGSDSTANRFMTNAALGTGALLVSSFAIPMMTGDSLLFKTDSATATQVAWANIIEYG